MMEERKDRHMSEQYLSSIVPIHFVSIVLLRIVRSCHLYSSNTLEYLHSVWLVRYKKWRRIERTRKSVRVLINAWILDQTEQNRPYKVWECVQRRGRP